MKIKVLEGEHLSRASHARLNFISDEKDSVLSRDPFQSRKEFGSRNHITSLTLNRLDNYRGDFLSVNSCPEDNILQIIGAPIWNVRYAGNQWSKSFALDRLGSCE